MLSFGEGIAVVTMGGAEAFFKGSGKTWTGSDFAETRAPTRQRFYNYACLAFGRHPTKFQQFKLDKAFLRRASFTDAYGKPYPGVTDDNNNCTYEFIKARRDVLLVMAPHIDSDKFEKLIGFQIFYPEDFQ